MIVNNGDDWVSTFDDPRIRVCRHCERASASYARNLGLRYVTGDLVCFFGDDDDMFPNYLSRFASAFAANPVAKQVRAGMVVCDGRTNLSLATPECCLRREYATSTWSDRGPEQDQIHFSSIITARSWSEERGDIIVIPEAPCRANADPRGGLGQGRY